MAKIVGDIAVQVGADIAPLQRGMRNAGRSVDSFGDKATKMGANVAKAGAIVVTAMTAAAGAVFAAANEAANAGREIQNLSDISGVGTTAFQRYAAGAKSVGVEQQKLADIFKDVNDKFGDFMATGAGPLADFFENIAPQIGVTAEQFARLSGPQALQLYVDSLQKAGVSQQQMTFYLEALASDTTALLPLLRDGGIEMRRFGDEAEAAGRILSESAIDSAVELDRELQILADTLRTQATEAILEYKDEIIAAAQFIVDDLIPAMGQIAQAAIDFASDLAPAIEALRKLYAAATGVIGIGEGLASGEGITRGEAGSLLEGAARLSPAGNLLLNARDGRNAERDFAAEAAGLNVVENDPVSISPVVSSSLADARLSAAHRQNAITRGLAPNSPAGVAGGGGRSRGGGGRSRGGGRSSGPDRDDLERLQERYASEEEQLEIHLQSELEKLEEYRQAKLGAEEEFNDLERQIKEKHLEDLAALEAAAQRARLQDIAGAFGDLSSLMQTENKKLFKVGQAAAIAEATVSGYQAAVDAWQKGMSIGGPPVAAAFAGASIAKTGALISQIANTSPTGGGGGTTNVGGSGQPSIASQGPLQVQLSGLGSNDLLRGADVGELLERLTDEAGDRGLQIAVTQ